MTHNQIVLNHLCHVGTLTAWQAIELYRIANLAQRISDLRLRGHNITTHMHTIGKSKFAIYSLNR